MSTQFKLTKPGGLTRRMTFGEQPSWLALAHKIEGLYDIPAENVAVAYVDKDGDEVTMSTQEELLDFYAHTHQRGESVKFTVIDLSATRTMRSAVLEDDEPVKVMSPGFGTLGPQVIFEADNDLGEWQRLPPLSSLFGVPGAEGPAHAFVEVVESDAQSSQGGKAKSPSLLDAADNSLIDKGKGKAWDGRKSSTVSSTGSVLDNEAPTKPPVHVYDMSDRDPQSPTAAFAPGTSSPRGADLRKTTPRINTFGQWSRSADPSPSPPNIQIDKASSKSSPSSSVISDISKPLPKTPSNISASYGRSGSPLIFAKDASSQATPKQAPVELGDASDPPLEETGADDANRAAPSLARDVSGFLDNVRNIFAAHPELSEGLRNIVRNASSGVYWGQESARVANAAASIHRAAQDTTAAAEELRRHAENESSRVAAEVLGSVFSAIGEITDGINRLSTHERDDAERAAPQAATPAAAPSPIHPGMVPPPPVTIFASPPGAPYVPNQFNGHGPFQRFGGLANPYMGGNFSVPPTRHHAHMSPRTGNHHMPPPPPPPPPHFHMPGSFPPVNVPPPPQPPLSGLSSVPGYGPVPPHQRTLPSWMQQLVGPHNIAEPPRRSNTWSAGHQGGQNLQPVPGDVLPSVFGAAGDSDEPMGPHERKAQLEAAKAYYKAEKERFRKEKEERRRTRREAEERRAEEGFATLPSDLETVVARIPLGIHRHSSQGPSGPRRGRGGFHTGHGRGRSFAEVYSVPAQHHNRTQETRVSASPRSEPQQPLQHGTVTPQPEERIIARLADMGFTTSTHPNILTMLQRQLHDHQGPKPDNEDTIVTKMLETLISQRTPSPRPSGSGVNRS